MSETELNSIGRRKRPKTIGKTHKVGYGYISIQTPSGWQYEHRYVWEKENGPLPPGYVVHHTNGDKTDNRIENLCAMPRRKHDALETKRRWENHKAGLVQFYDTHLNCRDLPDAEIADLYRDGMSLRSIGRRFGASHHTITAHLRRLGVVGNESPA